MLWILIKLHKDYENTAEYIGTHTHLKYHLYLTYGDVKNKWYFKGM